VAEKAKILSDLRGIVKASSRISAQKKAQPLWAALNPPMEEGGGDILLMPDGTSSRPNFHGSFAASQNNIINSLIIPANPH
jgi:hypothetical protein